MYVRAIKTRRVEPRDLLETVLDEHIKDLSEEDIIVITSKIISVIQGCLIPKSEIDKQSLVYKEADLLLDDDKASHDFYLTIKNGVLIPSAGIDESNADGTYILYPNNIQAVAAKIWQHLREKHKLKKFGVVITDSHTTIMRRGVTGVALGWCGFSPLYSYVGKKDIYGRELKVTQINILDSLATAAVFVMGEGNEQTPLALIKDAPHISFLDRLPTEEEEGSIAISMEEDLYAPLLRSVKWRKK
jgi:putative folate metabolism gamma-glutamate ligase